MAKNLAHIYKKSKTGDLVKVSAKEVKAFIMQAHGWTSEEYTKKRDIFKNRLRAFESFQRAQGKEVKSQNVVELLYKQAKAMKYYGKEYQPSQEIKRIESFSAVSITKGRQQAKRQGKAFNAINQRQLNYLKTRFGDIDNPKSGGFVNSNEGAKRIVQSFYEKAQKDGKPVMPQCWKKPYRTTLTAFMSKLTKKPNGKVVKHYHLGKPVEALSILTLMSAPTLSN